MKNIGPTFSAELSAAGLLGLPFAWAADGALTFGDAMTAEQIASVESVYAAHDPSHILPPATHDVTPRQIRMALSRVGLRASVEAAIAAGSQDLKDWYEFSTTFQRNQPLVIQMGIDLGQSPVQLDALWALAGTL